MERRELETAAARATYLRGLTAVPLGMLFLLTGLGNLGWDPVQGPVVFLACLLVLAGAYAGIVRYYNVNYGRVRIAKRLQLRFSIACFACFGTALVGGSLLDFRLDLSINLFVVSFGVAMLVWFAICTGLSKDHFVVWGALIVVGLIPVWGGPVDNAAAGWLPIGVATIIAGILDHHALGRSFGPVEPVHVDL